MFGPEIELASMSLWHSALDITLVSVIVYQMLLLLKGSRSGAVLVGIALIFLIFYLSQDDVLDLPTLNWLLDRFISSIAVLLVVLFQDDIRRALSSAVRAPMSVGSSTGSSAELDEVLRACAVLSQRSIGALIVIEQEADLSRYIEEGVKIDAEVSWQVLMSLFIPSHMNPTHDGAVIIRTGRISSAACFLPLAYGDDIPGNLGSRHRAAMGLADETDALVLVVSEESSLCAIAHMGQIELELKPSTLRKRLQELFDQKKNNNGGAWRGRWQRRIIHNSPSPLSIRITGEHSVDPSRTQKLHRQQNQPQRHTSDANLEPIPHAEANLQSATMAREETSSPSESSGAPPVAALEPIVTRPRNSLQTLDDEEPDENPQDRQERTATLRSGENSDMQEDL